MYIITDSNYRQLVFRNTTKETSAEYSVVTNQAKKTLDMI